MQIETSKIDSLVSTKSEKPNSQINTQLAINGYPAKRFKLEDTDNPYTNDYQYHMPSCGFIMN